MGEIQQYTPAQIAKIDDVKEAIYVKEMADAAQKFYEAQGDFITAQDAKEVSMRSALQAGKIYNDAPEVRGGDRRSKEFQSGNDCQIETPKQDVIVQAEEAGIADRTLRLWARLSGAIEQLEVYFAERMDQLREFTFADFARYAFMHIPESTGDEWYTPIEYIRSVHKVMGGIDLDPASSEQANKTIRAVKYFTKEDDGLQHDWPGRVFMNPPYSKNKPFAERLIDQFRSGITKRAIVLVGAHGIETQWFRAYWDYILCFTGHRIKFDTPEGEKIAGNINGSAFIHLGRSEDENLAFANEFQNHGFVVRRWPQ